MLFMYKTEQEMVGSTDTFFRKVSSYIIEDLKECEIRTVFLLFVITVIISLLLFFI